MNEVRPVKAHSDLTTLSLNNQTKFRLNEINKIRNYFNSEIQKRKTISKKLSKSIASLGYMDKVLIVLSATSGRVSMISNVNVIGIPEGKISSSFTLVFSLTTEIIKKLLKETRKKAVKHSKIIMLAISKLNSIKTLISQASIDLDHKS